MTLLWEKSNQIISTLAFQPFPKAINDNSGSDASGASGCGVDQEAGEGVAGAGLTHKGVEPGDLQWHCVSGLQPQDRWPGGNQKTLRCVAVCHLHVAALH